MKPRFAVEAHLSSLFDTQTEAPGDGEKQQKAAEEPTPHEHEELPAPRALPTSLLPVENEALAQQNAASVCNSTKTRIPSHEEYA